MTKEEFETIIKPIMLLNCKERQFIRTALLGNFQKWNDQKQLTIPRVGGSIPSQAELVAETADAYCPNCEAYIVNERVTYGECCDNCGTEIEWHE